MRNVAALLLGFALFSASPYEDRLWHLRNLGKAFYENPTTQTQAVEQFKQALALNPSAARERVNYGLALLKAGEIPAGIAELEKAQKQDPSIPHTWFNLGVQAKRAGEYERGITQMRGMLKLVPGDAKAHHNLAALLKLDGKPAEALKEFETASRLGPNLAGPHFQLYNAYRQAGRAADAARELASFQEVKKRQAGQPITEDMESSEFSEIFDRIDLPAAKLPQVQFAEKGLATGVTGIAAVGSDLVSWNASGVKTFRAGALVRNGFESLKNVVALEAGEDVCVITTEGAAIYRAEKGVYKNLEIALPEGIYRKAIWLDYDHDYDLDLMLLGDKPVLMRNNGDGTYTETTKAFPFVPGKPLNAVHFALHAETAARDLVVSYSDREGVLYEDLLNGQFRATPLPGIKAGETSLFAADFNHDSFIDLAASGTFLLNHDGRLEAAALPSGVNATVSAAFGDWIGTSLAPVHTALALEWNLADLAQDGTVRYFENLTAPKEHWLKIGLKGVKNVKSASTATVEVKAGATYNKKVHVNGPLWFPLAAYAEADTVRITWPNGLIQNEPRKKANEALTIVEAERLSGSCPMIFTWNGTGFEFITDVLGVAPLGASSADGKYFPVDHDEYIQIPGRALREKDGEYEVRITEELHEVSYLDQVQLTAVDHSATSEIFTNDKFKSPPFPEFRLFGVTRRVYAATARDGHGNDVRAALLRHDLQYPDAFARNLAGTAELHTLDLDFTGAAANGSAVLLLNGWVDWADGSTFLGESQRKGGGLVFPYLQMKDAAGEWRTVVEDMGIPSGKPKTITVDLTGKWLSLKREVRIVTNLCVYWDEIFLSEEVAAPQVRLTAMDARKADLHYRGFSTPVIHPARKQPERFDYAKPMPLTMWNPTPGMYTRYGDVTELVTSVDDRLLIMGAGDEVTLHYSSHALPPLPAGWRRDFLLLVDGWAKDADPNTAFGQTVEPLPFHGMSAYPYPKEENFPAAATHQKYRRDYLTRPALRLIRPLRETVSE